MGFEDAANEIIPRRGQSMNKLEAPFTERGSCLYRLLGR